MKELLPIGSIIEINDDERRFLIIGRCVVKDKQQYDYMCVEYPYGFYDATKRTYYNDEDVKNLIFLGDINN